MCANKRLLLVDDERNILRSIQRLLLMEDYEIFTAENGQEALDILRDNEIAVIMSDQRMPGMDGIELLKRAAEISPDTIRVMLTAFAETKTFIGSVNEARVSRLLLKPWHDDLLKSVIRDAIGQYNQVAENRVLQTALTEKVRAFEELNATFEKLLTERTLALKKSRDEMMGAFRGVAKTLTEVLETFSHGLRGHGRRVAVLSRMLAESENMAPDIIENVELAGQLHDIGLVSVPREIIGKSAQNWTRQETRLFQRHAELGYELTRNIPGFEEIANVVLCHHEAYDGSGYPGSRRGDKIPLGARIIAIANLFDRVMFPRGGAFFASRGQAKGVILREAGASLDPALARAFIEKVYPETEFLESDEIELPLSELTPGMELSRDILNVNGIVLVKQDTVLTERLIDKLSLMEGFDPFVSRVFVNRNSIKTNDTDDDNDNDNASIDAARVDIPRAIVDENRDLPLVVVVDDEQPVGEALKRELYMEDFAVKTFTHPETALGFIRNPSQNILAVITDFNMPKMTGDKLTRMIHEARPDLPVILITAFATKNNIIKFKDSGLTRVLVKPWNKSELLRVLEEQRDKPPED